MLSENADSVYEVLCKSDNHVGVRKALITPYIRCRYGKGGTLTIPGSRLLDRATADVMFWSHAKFSDYYIDT